MWCVFFVGFGLPPAPLHIVVFFCGIPHHEGVLSKKTHPDSLCPPLPVAMEPTKEAAFGTVSGWEGILLFLPFFFV